MCILSLCDLWLRSVWKSFSFVPWKPTNAMKHLFYYPSHVMKLLNSPFNRILQENKKKDLEKFTLSKSSFMKFHGSIGNPIRNWVGAICWHFGQEPGFILLIYLNKFEFKSYWFGKGISKAEELSGCAEKEAIMVKKENLLQTSAILKV